MISNLPDDRAFRRRLHRATGTLLAALLLPLLILLGLVQFLLNSAHWVDHSDQVVSRATAVEKLLLEMQSGARGYRLLKDPDSLGTYTAARSEIGPELRSLSDFVSDNPTQVATLGEVQRETTTWMQAADSTLGRLEAGEAVPLPAVPSARANMSRALADTQAFIAEEGRVRVSRSATLDGIVTTLIFVFGAAALVGLPVLAWWLQRLLREVGASYETSLTTAIRRATELQVTLSSIGDALIATDAVGKVDFLNPVAEALTGWSSAEARGRELREVFPIFREGTGEPTPNPVAQVLRENVVVGLANHTVLRARDGREHPIEDSAAPIRDEAGAVRGVILVFRDVTEKRAADRRLEESIQLFALRAEIAAQFDARGSLDQTLQACCQLIVQHLDAAFARVWTIEPAATTLVLRASAGLYTHLNGGHAVVPVGAFKIGRIAASRQPHLTNDVPHDPNISDPDWARREGMVAFAGYPLLADGAVIGVLATFARHPLSEAVLADLDPIAQAISQHIERRRAEAALQQARNEAEAQARTIADSAHRFRLLAEMIALQVWTATLDGQLDYANPECVAYFGGNLERDILGNAWAQFVHPDDLAPVVQSWQASLASGERYETEFRLRGRDGAYRWFLVRAEAMRDAEGRMVKWFGTNTDVNDLKTAQDASERASRAKDGFLAALSHELRTPLTPVLMTAAALRDDERLPKEVREQLGMMERNIALEARLIDDLLDLTAISRGKLPLRTERCDAHSLVGLAIEIVAEEVRAKGISLERDLGARRGGLLVDPARFQQVIWNLLRNSVKFTTAGGKVSVRTRDETTAKGEAWFRLEVADSGIGIEPARLEQIFQPFDQGGLTGDHRFGGMGLGLAIARAVVDQHGGRIHAESAGRGRGSTFIVELPEAAPPSAESNGTAPSAPAAPASPPPAAPVSLRLLVVEDHESTLQALVRLLQRDGHRVSTASSVAGAMAVAATSPFDLVISDLGLPDGTGNQLMEQLRAAHGLRGVALSGYGMEEDLARSRAAGFVAHLVKPVHFGDLRRVLANLPSA